MMGLGTRCSRYPYSSSGTKDCDLRPLLAAPHESESSEFRKGRFPVGGIEN